MSLIFGQTGHWGAPLVASRSKLALPVHGLLLQWLAPEEEQRIAKSTVVQRNVTRKASKNRRGSVAPSRCKGRI